MRSALFIALAALAVLAAGPAPAQTDAPTASWYVIQTDAGERLGHASREIIARVDGREIVATQRMYLADEGGSPTMHQTRTVYRETTDGRTYWIESRSGAGRTRARITARIQGDVALIERETASGLSAVRVALPPGVRFDEGQGLLRNWDRGATPRLEFDSFDIDAMGVERVMIEASGAAETGRIAAVRRRYDGAQLMGVARLLLAADGRVTETVQPLFGMTIHVVETDRENAERLHPPYRVLPNLMTRLPFRIPDVATRGHIRYRFAYREGMNFVAPQTGDQRVAVAPDAVTLDICAQCGPGLASDSAALADALRPTPWLQSDHPRLRAIAAPVARLDISDVRKMNMLLERARPYLGRIDFRGHYSALDTLSRRAGDCTEAAVLLAALGRAAGIPTRVASGLVYSRARYHGVSNALMPHSWTLAWADGQWRSFDLALDAFDSTHIALTVGDGDARSIAAAGELASLLRLESAAEIRRSGG